MCLRRWLKHNLSLANSFILNGSLALSILFSTSPMNFQNALRYEFLNNVYSILWWRHMEKKSLIQFNSIIYGNALKKFFGA